MVAEGSSDAPRAVRRGRPRLDGDYSRRSTLTLSLSASMHDALIERAKVSNVAVSAFVRQLIVAHFVTPKSHASDSSAQ
jgi:hypothetical protein